MAEFRYVSDREAAERHKKAKTARLTRAQHREASSAPIRNVEPVLSLGEMTYFQFRGRAYGVPPLPWKTGKRMMQIYTTTIGHANLVATTGDKEAERVYFEGLEKLQNLLWKSCRPTGLIPRIFASIGLARNPFRNATEKEILDHTDFFLALRMKSNVQNSPEQMMEPAMSRTRLTS